MNPVTDGQRSANVILLLMNTFSLALALSSSVKGSHRPDLSAGELVFAPQLSKASTSRFFTQSAFLSPC